MGLTLHDGNGRSLQTSTSPLAGAIVVADSNATVVQWIPQWTYIHAVAALTTSSASDVTIADMVVVPGAGTYEVEFYCTTGNSANANSVVMTLYIGGVAVTASSRTVITGGGNRGSQFLAANLTFDGTQILEVKWNTNAGTATIIGRTLRLKAVG